MVSAATLIWISCRPLLRLMFCVACGVAITKADLFPPVAAAGAGQVLLNITLPCLMFSKIVPAFTSQNVTALGPLVVVALLYEAIGMLLAILVKQFFWVPHRFRYGIIVAGGWGNVGDIPTAVVMSVTGAAPFHGVDDQNLAVAYLSAFLLVFMITLFPLGGHKLVAWDFQGPNVEPEEIREAMRLKRIAVFHIFSRLWARYRGVRAAGSGFVEAATEKRTGNEVSVRPLPQMHTSFVDSLPTAVPTDGTTSAMCSHSLTEIQRHNPQSSSAKPESIIKEAMPSADKRLTISMCEVVESDMLPSPAQHTTRTYRHINNAAPSRSRISFFSAVNLKTVSGFWKALLTPASMTIFVSFLIALVPKLKALFVAVPGTFMPSAPDGQPPLAFILDSTTFVGAASVPLGLVCLGSSVARLNWPRKGEWQRLPLGAISWIAISKMAVMPVLGVLICEGLTNVGFISREDKVLRFVCIFLSCLPTATVHVLLTQVYSGTGSSEHLAPFLIPQYVLMFISMTAITAYTIELLF